MFNMLAHNLKRQDSESTEKPPSLLASVFSWFAFTPLTFTALRKFASSNNLNGIFKQSPLVTIPFNTKSQIKPTTGSSITSIQVTRAEVYLLVRA